MHSTEESDEWTISAANVAQKSAKSNFLPFGAGRHRCIGEAFAFIQIKTIVSHIIRDFEFKLGKAEFPKHDYTKMFVTPVFGELVKFTRRSDLAAKEE